MYAFDQCICLTYVLELKLDELGLVHYLASSHQSSGNQFGVNLGFIIALDAIQALIIYYKKTIQWLKNGLMLNSASPTLGLCRNVKDNFSHWNGIGEFHIDAKNQQTISLN